MAVCERLDNECRCMDGDFKVQVEHMGEVDVPGQGFDRSREPVDYEQPAGKVPTMLLSMPSHPPYDVHGIRGKEQSVTITPTDFGMPFACHDNHISMVAASLWASRARGVLSAARASILMPQPSTLTSMYTVRLGQGQ